tara:strand:- start:5 stop:589 length:585 start_codon:yes stop_codon:yes gene_type:complete
MKNSSLANILKTGLYGDRDKNNTNNILKIKELKNLFIFQIAKYKKSNIDFSNIILDNLKLPITLHASYNEQTRILWMGPDIWLVISEKKEIGNLLKQKFSENDFSLTDLSHSRTIIEIEGKLVPEVIKKGCPLNLTNLKGGNCSNSVFHAITVTLDFISDDPKKIRILALRSFGESLYESITDACLEFGYKIED